MLDGELHPDFADAAAVLLRVLPKKAPGGAAVCIYHRGRKVVDIWGGTRDRDGNPWRADTTAPSFSTTKGVLSTLLHVVLRRHGAYYDDPIARYWPEFAANGKEAVTIRQALCHEAGLYRIDELITHAREILDWEHMKALVAAARPAHEPGTRHGYHALTYGWLIGGLIEALEHRALAEVLADDLVAPLGLDGAFIGLPAQALERRALLIAHDGVMRPRPVREAWQERLAGWFEALLARMGVELAEFRSALTLNEPFDWNAVETVTACIPAANGQFTARSLARMYAMIACGGELDGVRLLSEDQVREIGTIRNRTRDRVLFLPMHWRMGYHRAFAPGASAPMAFGHYGYGGSGAFCDPSRELAVAFTVNSGVGGPTGDARMPRIARAAIRAVDRVRHAEPR